MCAIERTVVNSINSNRVNELFLANVKLSEQIIAFNNIEQITKCDLLFLVSPAQHTRAVLKEISKTLEETTPIILCSKGIEISSLKLMSQIAEEILEGIPILGSVAAGGLIETFTDVSENLALSEISG